MIKGKVAYVFPGQGAQRIGMGLVDSQDSDMAKELFKLIDKKLGFSLSKLCFEGPDEELKKTINCQPAILAVSYIYYMTHCCGLRRLKLDKPAFFAGHSLGQYTAFVIADVINLLDGVFLVRERGRLMQEAEERNPGGMAAVMNLDKNTLNTICKETGVVISNINCPGQFVISGPKECLGRACKLVSSKGARAIPLRTGGAFHSREMESIIPGMTEALSKVKLHKAEIPIIANSSAKPIARPEEIREESIIQLSSAVQWQASIEYMINEGVCTFVEIGPGDKVLSGLIRRIDSDVEVINIKEI